LLTRLTRRACAALAGCALASLVPRAPSPARLPLIPYPKQLAIAAGTLRLPTTLACHLADSTLRELLPVLSSEYRMLTGGEITEAAPSTKAPCRLAIDPTLAEEQYRLIVDNGVRLTGGSYRAVAMGTVTLLQLLERGSALPRLTIDDHPSVPFRGLLVDLGRQWHDIPVLEQLVELCRFYKIGYLQLHLTDDQIFSFPTSAFPELPSPGQHYTRDQLRALDEFARVRGVYIVPELEAPGHASLMIQRRPDIFGFTGVTEWRGTLNMGRDQAYVALDSIIGEIADVFRAGPFIHIGGDEATLDPLASDPDVLSYMREHNLADVHELYRQFLVRMNDMVKRHGKRTLVWEGFRKQDDNIIPRDMRVFAWETVYQLPQDLLAGGYTVMNSSWKPLYITWQRKWPVEYIYDTWNLWRWENWVPKMPSFTPIQLDSTSQVIGAMMCAWEQPQWVELFTTRRRLAAMAERTWNGSVRPEHPFAWFEGALARTDEKLGALISPVTIQARGLTFPNLHEGHYDEERWFDDTLVVRLGAAPGQTVRYTLDRSAPNASSSRYTRPIRLDSTTHVRAQAFDPSGSPVGWDRWIEYQFHPIRADVRGSFEKPLSALWELIDDAAKFRGTATVRLSSSRRGVIRYTLNDSTPKASSPAYTSPITIRDTATVRAQLFSPSGAPLGAEYYQRFARVP
jgi:N-acetyl-beta-hexosaminidase